LLPNALQQSKTDHVPVLADEVRELLDVQPGATVVDGTFGAGGHSRVLASVLAGRGRLIAIDRDPEARTYFDRFRRELPQQSRFLRGDFAIVLNQLAENGVEADAVILDLGVSSMQIDRPERGFSYAVDAPLDMRMDPSAPQSAREIVNELDERELADVLRRYGEERFARQIARAIVRRRSRPRSRRRAVSAMVTPPSASSRRFASPSTRSSSRSSARFPRRSRCCGRGVAWPSSASTRSRTASSNASSPPRPVAACVRPTSPSAYAGTSRACAS
jgi:16S rRNA (cytosine(1402)-N(4))-methyltransferase